MTSNKERGDRAYRYAHLYMTEILDGEDDIESAITDLMADLAHLSENDYYDGEVALRLATAHYREERETEE